MPNRILREGILTSPRVARLGGWAEEVFYRRLMSVVDDFGRYYADAGLVRAACYPRQLNKVSDSDIGKWLTACVNAALVRVYPAQDGESYLQMIDFRQQARAAKSKFPNPPSECIASAEHPAGAGASDAHLGVFGGVDEGVTEAKASGADAAAGIPDCPHQAILALWAKVLPALPQHNAKRWDGARADALKARWRETAQEKAWTTQEQGLRYFEKLFGFIDKSDFLAGRKEPLPGRRRFAAELEWVVTRSKWDRLIEGKYHDDDATDDEVPA